MAKKLLGKAYIRVDGKLLETMAGAKLDLGGETRETVVGNNAVLGHTGKPKQAKLECEIAVGQGVSLDELRKVEDATVTFEADTGQTYTLKNAWLVEPPVLTDGEGGKVPLVFEATPADEQVAS